MCAFCLINKSLVFKKGCSFSFVGFKKFFEGQNWDEVSSHLEKLPYFARELKKNTPRADCHQADASELFTFAKNPGWEKKLDPKILD